MIALYFGDVISAVTTLLLAVVIVLIALSIKDRNRIKKWGRRIAFFLLVATAISAFSATRDAFAAPGAVFEMMGVQSLICAIAGVAQYITAIISIFLKNQTDKRRCFYILSALFAVQVLTVEGSRILMVLGVL